jgi:hypothetical protein
MPVNPGAGSAELVTSVASVTPELTAGLIMPGTGMCTSTEGSCSERIACDRGSGSRQLHSARRLLDDPYGHLSRVWLSHGRSRGLCELPSRGTALILLRSAATAGAEPHHFRSESTAAPTVSPWPLHQNISGPGRFSVACRALHDSRRRTSPSARLGCRSLRTKVHRGHRRRPRFINPSRDETLLGGGPDGRDKRRNDED